MSELLGKMDRIENEDWRGPLYSTLRKSYIERKMPLSGMFELTPHCTLDCKMCYIHSSEEKYEKKILSGDEWIQIMDAAVDAGMLYATLTGGECMLHPDFRRIYQHLRNKGVFVRFYTNGTLLDEENVQWLRERKPHNLKVSIYGSNPEEYERVTGKAEAFYKVDKALDLLYQAQIVTNITITVSKYNYEKFENILRYVNTKHYNHLGIDMDMVSPYKETGRNINDFALDLKDQENIWRAYYRQNGKDIPDLCETDYLPAVKGISEEKRQQYLNDGIPCAAGKSSFFVSYSGRMQPCVLFADIKEEPLKSGFATAWNKINTKVWEYRRSNECEECQFLGLCCFCPGTYKEKNGLKDHAGDKPCDKKKRMLSYVMQQKAGGK